MSYLLRKSTILALDVDPYRLDDILGCWSLAEACSFIAAFVLHFLVFMRTYSRVVDIPTARTVAWVLRAVDKAIVDISRHLMRWNLFSHIDSRG